MACGGVGTRVVTVMVWLPRPELPTSSGGHLGRTKPHEQHISCKRIHSRRTTAPNHPWQPCPPPAPHPLANAGSCTRPQTPPKLLARITPSPTLTPERTAATRGGGGNDSHEWLCRFVWPAIATKAAAGLNMWPLERATLTRVDHPAPCRHSRHAPLQPCTRPHGAMLVRRRPCQRAVAPHAGGRSDQASVSPAHSPPPAARRCKMVAALRRRARREGRQHKSHQVALDATARGWRQENEGGMFDGGRGGIQERDSSHSPPPPRPVNPFLS